MTSRPHLHLLPGRFPLLMALYEENFLKLRKLFPLVRQLSGACVSQLDGSPELWMQSIAQERHTSILLLTHRFEREGNVDCEPAAYVRVYYDAQQAEVTHFRYGHALRELFSTDQQVERIAQRRLRLNTFFGKWLDFLERVGHGPESFVRSSQRLQPEQENSRNLQTTC